MKKALWLCCLMFFTLLPAVSRCETYALLIGVEHFADAADAYPAATGNVQRLSQVLCGGYLSPEHLTIADSPPADADALTQLIRTAFAAANEEDVCLTYLCTHGRRTAEGESVLVLSDGVADTLLTAKQLESAFDDIDGHIFLILDACYCGGLIGKGQAALPDAPCFRDGRFSVLTACAALEETYYYIGGAQQGAFYFTELLVQALNPAAGIPCDLSRDGAVSLTELYQYLAGNCGSGHPQCTPQSEDTSLLFISSDAAAPQSSVQSPVFRNTFLQDEDALSLSFTVTQPIRVGYQLVPWQAGWRFSDAQLYYDTAESQGAPESYRGYLTPGRKTRSLSIDTTALRQLGGYMLLQLESFSEAGARVHAASVLSVPADEAASLIEENPPILTVQRIPSGEIQLTVYYPCPCRLWLYAVDSEGSRVAELQAEAASAPIAALGGETFYLDAWPEGAAKVVAQLDFGGGEVVQVRGE